jgi:formate dehydrogenase major subunit/formate dehydrogenase alpha subunit
MLDARCESCGQCVAYCPVGALYDKMSLKQARPNKVQKVLTTCSYCGVGCTFDLNVRDGKIVRVTSNPEAPVNGLALCVKGRYGYDYVHHPERLRRPLVRAKWLKDIEGHVARGEWQIAGTPVQQVSSDNGGMTPDTFIETDWDAALDVVAHRFAQVKAESGGDAFGMLASAKCTNEENYLFSKFTRQILTTHTIDHCARL